MRDFIWGVVFLYTLYIYRQTEYELEELRSVLEKTMASGTSKVEDLKQQVHLYSSHCIVATVITATTIITLRLLTRTGLSILRNCVTSSQVIINCGIATRWQQGLGCPLDTTSCIGFMSEIWGIPLKMQVIARFTSKHKISKPVCF